MKWLAGAAAGGAALGGGLSVVGGLLRSLGIPKDSVIKYERAIKAEKYLLVAYDTAENIEDATGLLETSAELAEVHELGED